MQVQFLRQKAVKIPSWERETEARREMWQHARIGDNIKKKSQAAPPGPRTSVYVAARADETIYPEFGNEEDCGRLTEQGYDRLGRRVLVEWTLCFDQNGTAYVPAEGRRILARY